MNNLSVLGKFLDQPKLVEKFEKAVPAILVTGGALYGAKNIYQAPESQKKKTAINNVVTIGAVVLSALAAPKIASKFVKESHEHCEKNIAEVIDDFLKNNKLSQKTAQYLSEAKEKILNPRKIKLIYQEIKPMEGGQKFLDEFIPNPENIDSKHIFSEIKELSILGLIPVLGGITGGVAADRLTEKNWKSRIPDKIKEGSYQYLANIFLCNIGAGAALLVMEKANIKSKALRAVGMIGGIILTGVVLGSAVANLIGKVFIDPLFSHKHSHNHNHLYSDRHPEAIDMGLHVDDIATVAVLSGLKWIEPALPILYSISGYRAGIGYRNGDR